MEEVGTRLWTMSRTLISKQSSKLFNNKSLFQLTAQRNSKISQKQLIVSNNEQYFLALDQIEELTSYVLEPIGRNTTPAIAIACITLDKEKVVLITPSDHLIKDIIGFKGKLYFNDNKPDGTMNKLTNPSKLHSLGWKHKVKLNKGIQALYHWYLKDIK